MLIKEKSISWKQIPSIKGTQGTRMSIMSKAWLFLFAALFQKGSFWEDEDDLYVLWPSSSREISIFDYQTDFVFTFAQALLQTTLTSQKALPRTIIRNHIKQVLENQLVEKNEIKFQNSHFPFWALFSLFFFIRPFPSSRVSNFLISEGN